MYETNSMYENNHYSPCKGQVLIGNVKPQSITLKVFT